MSNHDLRQRLLSRVLAAENPEDAAFWRRALIALDKASAPQHPGALTLQWCRFVAGRETTLADHRRARQEAAA